MKDGDEMTDSQVRILVERWGALMREANALREVLAAADVEIITSPEFRFLRKGEGIPYYAGPPLEDA